MASTSTVEDQNIDPSQIVRQAKSPVSVFDDIYERQHVRGVARNISQMSHISEQGISNEKELATVSKQRERILTERSTLTKVKALVKRLQAVNASLWIVQSADRSVILEDLNDKLDRMQRSKQLPAGLGKTVAVLKNELRSNIDLVTSRPKIRSSSLDVSASLEKLDSLIDKKIESCNLHLQLLAEGKSVKETMIEKSLTDGQAVATLAANSDKAKLVLKSGKESAYVSGISIIPITKAPVNVAKLSKNLSVSDLSGYPLLHDQKVIGFKPNTGDTQKLLAVVLSKYKEKTGKTLMAVTDKGHRYNGIIWYWIADQATINSIIAASSGQSLIIKQWGFSI